MILPKGLCCVQEVTLLYLDAMHGSKVKLDQACDSGPMPIHGVGVCAVRNLSKFRLAVNARIGLPN